MPALRQLVYENLHSDSVEQGWRLGYYSVKKKKPSKSGGSDRVGVDWSEALVAEEFHLIFNISGQAMIMGARIRIGLASSTLAMCYPNGSVTATRLDDGENHEFVILSMKLDWLRKVLGNGQQSIYPVIWESIYGSKADRAAGKPLGKIRSMTLGEKNMAQQLSDPPVETAAEPFWYAAKVTEVLALHMFSPEKESVAEPFCLSQKRINRERMDSVIEWLEDHIEDPLDLSNLAQHIGCAPHYLSRLFSKEMGRTISQYLRALRIENAADLMDRGRHNVTEAAFEVGYNSMSHFTKAFLIEKGVTPSAYLIRGE